MVTLTMFFKTKKQIKFIIYLILNLILIQPIYSDLGEANIKPYTLGSQKKSFDAWCGEKNNKCKVSFKTNYLIVNQSSGIKPEQLLSWFRNVSYIPRKGIGSSYHLYVYDFEYRNKNNENSYARVIFQNSKTSDKFYKELKNWAPGKERNCNYDFDLRKVVC